MAIIFYFSNNFGELGLRQKGERVSVHGEAPEGIENREDGQSVASEFERLLFMATKRLSGWDAKEIRKLSKLSRIFEVENKYRTNSPNVHEELKERGFFIGRHKIARLMRVNGLNCRSRKAYVVTSRADKV